MAMVCLDYVDQIIIFKYEKQSIAIIIMVRHSYVS